MADAPGPYEVGGFIAFAGAVYELLRRHLRKQDGREELEAKERSAREERTVKAMEGIGEGMKQQAASQAVTAAAIAGVVVEVRELGREVRDLRDDICELTPVAGIPTATSEQNTPVRVPPTVVARGEHFRRGAGGKDG